MVPYAMEPPSQPSQSSTVNSSATAVSSASGHPTKSRSDSFHSQKSDNSFTAEEYGTYCFLTMDGCADLCGFWVVSSENKSS